MKNDNKIRPYLHLYHLLSCRWAVKNINCIHFCFILLLTSQ